MRERPLTAPSLRFSIPRMRLESCQVESEAVLAVAGFMCVAARTAPKAKGLDHLSTLVLTGEEKEVVAQEMDRVGEQTEAPFFIRDAANLRQAPAVVLIGIRGQTLGLPACGFCGFTDCAENESKGGICAFNLTDLGIAVGSAVSVAANHRVDCRVFFSAGRAALNLGLLGPEVRVAYGIPLSVTGKSPFFDRR
jgi:uncharacterized ferredoxin-like protein